MEADFNSVNEEIYSKRMMDNARRHNLIPEEIFSEHGKMEDDDSLTTGSF